jgi:carboxyl-terminal processing protease
MKNERIKVWLPLFLSISMALGMMVGYKMRDNFPRNAFFSLEKRNITEEILQLIKNKYVDDINTNQLADSAIQAILNQLDPHSVYIEPKELTDINNQLNGKFYGIGVEFEIFNDTLNVIHVIEGSPALKAGFLKGDQFIKANGKNIAGVKISADSIRNILRGDRGSLLAINLLRNGKNFTLSVSRDLIPMNSIDASFMMNDQTGYIRINQFSTQTYREFMTALMNLKKQGLKKLILDLRDNGGGILSEAVEIADEFLSGDKLITYTQGKHSPKKEYRCKREGQFENGDLILLCNENSASASEVLMGALQDWDRATIIGKRSFGKGLVQEQFDLNGLGAVRLTIARYYTPIGRSIQKSYEKGKADYYNEVQNRKKESAITSNQKYFTTPGGKKLYESGGISPDIEISEDSSSSSIKFNEFITKNLLNYFAHLIITHQSDFIKKYPTPHKLYSSFFISDNDWDILQNLILKNKPTASPILSTEERSYLQEFIKTLIANQIWSKDGYFRVSSERDHYIIKALEVIK